MYVRLMVAGEGPEHFDLSNCARTKNWFVAQLRPNGLSLAQRNLARQGYEHLMPHRLEAVQAARGATTRMKPLFPGYIFVRVHRHARWQAINSTRGIARLVLSDPRNPRPLPDGFMEGLMARCDEAGCLQASHHFTAGDRIRVLSGPFAELIARVEDLSEDMRLRLLVDLMGQKVRVEVPATIVERAH